MSGKTAMERLRPGEYISQGERREALAFRIEAARFARRKPVPPSQPAAALDAFLSEAPEWVIGRAARLALSKDGFGTGLGARAVLAEAASQAGIGYMPFAASGTDFRTVLRMRAGRLSDPDAVLGELERLKEEFEARYAAQDAYGRRYMRERRKAWERPYGLDEAMKTRGAELAAEAGKEGREEDAKARAERWAGMMKAFSADLGDGYSARPCTPKEARAIGISWKDGWTAMSPANAARGHVAGPEYRRDLAVKMAASGMMVGVFAGDGTPAGSVSVTPLPDGGAVLGWHVAPEFRGQGLSERAVSALASFLHENGVARLVASCLLSNQASMRSATKLGFSQPGDEVRLGTDLDWTTMTADAADVARAAGANAMAP